MRVRILVKVGAAVLVAAASSIAMAQHQAPYPMQSESSGTRPEGTAATTKRKAAAKRATRSTLSGGGDSFEPRGFSSGGGVSPSSGAYVPPH